MTDPLFTQVDDWVDYIQTLHAREIEMGLERVAQVYERLFDDGFAPVVISVAGTNGKGSCAELLRACYVAAGFRVGKYTSPHLLRFNERIVVGEQSVTDRHLMRAFERVEVARGATPLTYFEFGTLVALVVMSEADVDVTIMEVGLGGRLDAVNILDSAISIITSISIDHTAWLGSTLEQIAVEKAGIVRSGCAVVIGTDPSFEILVEACQQRGAVPIRRDVDFKPKQTDRTWSWCKYDRQIDDLPLPFGQTGVQLQNAACVVAAIEHLQSQLAVSDKALRSGLRQASLAGRAQVIAEAPYVVVDVAHNQDSVRSLRDFIERNLPEGRVIVVCGMLKDKEIGVSLSEIQPLVDQWHLATINVERGATADALELELQATAKTALNEVSLWNDVQAAYDHVMQTASEDDCVVIFGSFYVVADILAHHQRSP